MQRHPVRKLGIALVSAALAATGGLALAATPATAEPVTWTFDDVGEHDVSVPEGVCEITVDAYGAEGGGLPQEYAGRGGLGGRARAQVEVTPGETLLVNVGGVGILGGAGGFNGGGAGGDRGGSGGGGASDVRRAPWALADRIVVAGGGGGAPNAGYPGGAGGGASGEPGSAGPSDNGGGGGTQTAGGAAGGLGTNGALGSGGDGGSSRFYEGGGGGGGGLFGGGGGSEWEVSWPGYGPSAGGGGSGFTPDGFGMETGVREGDGLVTITAHPCLAEPGDAVGEHSFTVPPGVCEITVDAFGAQGGDDRPATGGRGGHAHATLSVTPGETLTVMVGGAGGDGTPAGAPGGFNGGGDGGASTFPTVAGSGAGGGGASDVRRAPFGLEDRLVVAGGGGGAAWGIGPGTPGGSGGAGGGTNGEPGAPNPVHPGDPGAGGTQTAGGAGGGSGTAGTLGTGGTGGTGDIGGGGGGGGLFGGGGGTHGEVSPLLFFQGPGGGGSGFTPDGTGLTTGVHSGDGRVEITSDPDAGTCAHHQPDAHARVLPRGAWAGDDTYSADGAGQTVAALSLRLFTAAYEVRIENDGDANDVVTVTGAGSSPGFTVRYLVGGADVTADVVAGAYVTPTLAPGDTHSLTVRVAVGVAAPLLGSHVATVRATSTGDPGATDAVRAVTRTV